MLRPKFSLAGLLGTIAVVCLGLSIYEVASESPQPTMRSGPGCVFGGVYGRVYEPRERVYIAGSSDSNYIVYRPNF